MEDEEWNQYLEDQPYHMLPDDATPGERKLYDDREKNHVSCNRAEQIAGQDGLIFFLRWYDVTTNSHAS